jgi:hypothetical protein
LISGSLRAQRSASANAFRREKGFGITRSKDDAPEFFGRDTRYIHRFYGGVIINMVR